MGGVLREVFVDYNHVGRGQTAHTRMFGTERDHLVIGEVISAVGDSVQARRARVVAIDGSDVTIQFLEPLEPTA